MRYLYLILCCCTITAFAQERIDGMLAFQTDLAKKYSIYIPSTYDATAPSKMMLGLHPLNTNRWDAESWCDTLIQFAEMNDLLLICPDGGSDGAIDDPIDTAFTTVILDSMLQWYAVDESQIYAMGFSWGGKTTYTYGLHHADRFAGFMPIGAATSISDVNGISANAKDKPFYIVHGANDSPNTRFAPMRDAMMDAGACVETVLLAGVGHTIDFPNRNLILTAAFDWLQAQSQLCAPTSTIQLAEIAWTLYPNPIAKGHVFQIDLPKTDIDQVRVFDVNGQLIYTNSNELPVLQEAGIYFIQIRNGETFQDFKVVVE